ncbi:MAG: Rpn family recombination-promoting nuclease/putative transposase [Turicibacter sp.]|nr:Rpn family recombination-promoting nuclease/putative transposase [Turicibacter sp.]
MTYHDKRTLQELNLCDDFLFSKVFSDPKICRPVLEQILNIEIERVEQVIEQRSINLMLESKSVRLDVYVKDEKGTVYNVEMQNDKHPDSFYLPKRSRYYQGNIDLELLQKGKNYSELGKSFVIFICTFDPFKMGRHLYTFKNTCQEESSLCLNDERTILFLNTKGTLNDVDDSMCEFLNYIENTSDTYAKHSRSSLIKLLNDKVLQVKHDKRLEVEWMTLLEIQEREHQKGFKAGIEQGIIQGQQQGAKQRNIEIAKNLIKNGLGNELISDSTGLSLEEVEALRNN